MNNQFGNYSQQHEQTLRCSFNSYIVPKHRSNTCQTLLDNIFPLRAFAPNSPKVWHRSLILRIRLPQRGMF